MAPIKLFIVQLAFNVAYLIYCSVSIMAYGKLVVTFKLISTLCVTLC